MNPRRVLVADDDADIREALRDVLVDEGWTVLEAENGEEALRVISETQLDLVLLDLMMPVLSGWDALQRIRADPRLASLPLAVVTADPSQAPPGEHVIAKPLDLSALLLILAALDEPKSIRVPAAARVRRS